MSNFDKKLHAIRLKTLLNYAESNGWHKVSAYGANADLYSKEGEFEVLMPRRETLDDYQRAVSEILRVFALEAEKTNM